jgi:hypothetical protein
MADELGAKPLAFPSRPSPFLGHMVELGMLLVSTYEKQRVDEDS